MKMCLLKDYFDPQGVSVTADSPVCRGMDGVDGANALPLPAAVALPGVSVAVCPVLCPASLEMRVPKGGLRRRDVGKHERAVLAAPDLLCAARCRRADGGRRSGVSARGPRCGVSVTDPTRAAPGAVPGPRSCRLAPVATRRWALPAVTSARKGATATAAGEAFLHLEACSDHLSRQQ